VRRREASFESIPETPRYYDNMRDAKRPERAPKQGGAVRALVLFILLGGGALAAGLYFGAPGQFASILSGRDDTSNATTTSASATPPAPAPADAPYTDTPPSDNSSNVEPTPQRFESASNNVRPTAPSRPLQQPARPRNQQADDTATPPPQTSWGANAP